MTKSLVAVCVVTTILSLQAQDAKPYTQHLWLLLKKTLMGADGPEYFEMNMQGAQLPPLAGKLVSATPTDHPSILLLAMDEDKPQVTLRLPHGYRRPIAVGSIITFEGVAVSFKQEPFMVTFEVETDRLTIGEVKAENYPSNRHFHKSLNAVTSSWMAWTFGVSPSSLHCSQAFPKRLGRASD
jgi:hypothetical protein